MKRIMAGLISGVFFTGLFLGTAVASGDDHYEYGERYEHGRYYNPYASNNNSYYNNGYRNHEQHEYDHDDYRYRPSIQNSYVNPSVNSSYSGNSYDNSNYRNHELYEYSR